MEITKSMTKVFDIEGVLLSKRFELLSIMHQAEDQNNRALARVTSVQFEITDRLYENIFDTFFNKKRALFETISEEQVIQVCKGLLDEIIAGFDKDAKSVEDKALDLRSVASIASSYQEHASEAFKPKIG